MTLTLEFTVLNNLILPVANKENFIPIWFFSSKMFRVIFLQFYMEIISWIPTFIDLLDILKKDDGFKHTEK